MSHIDISSEWVPETTIGVRLARSLVFDVVAIGTMRFINARVTTAVTSPIWARRQALLDRQEAAAEALGIADHRVDAGGLDGVEHAFRLVGVGRQRRFEKYRVNDLIARAGQPSSAAGTAGCGISAYRTASSAARNRARALLQLS